MHVRVKYNNLHVTRRQYKLCHLCRQLISIDFQTSEIRISFPISISAVIIIKYLHN